MCLLKWLLMIVEMGGGIFDLDTDFLAVVVGVEV